MKRSLFLIIFFFSALFTLVLASDLTVEGLKGSVEKVVTGRFTYRSENGQWLAGELEIRRIKVFSPLGDYQTVALYMNGVHYSRHEYTYDENGRKLESRYYKNDSENYTTREIYTYDDRGRLIEEITMEYWPVFLGGDRLSGKTVLAYDDRGYISLKRLLNDQGVILSSVRLTYDDGGRLIRESHYGKDGKLESILLYKYEGDVLRGIHSLDSSNRILEEVVAGGENGLNDRTQYGYSGDRAVRSSRTLTDGYISVNEIVDLTEIDQPGRRVEISFTLEPLVVTFDTEETLQAILSRNTAGRITGVDFKSGNDLLAGFKYYFDNAGRLLAREYTFGENSLRIDYRYDTAGNWIEERYFRLENQEYRPVSTLVRQIDYFE